MSVHLDSGAVSAFAGDAALLTSLRRRREVPQLIAAVLTECLTGDHRRDFAINRFLRACQVRTVDEPLGRAAGALRYAARRPGVSAVDALVVALAARDGGGTIFTSDPDDLGALAAQVSPAVRIVRA